MLVRDLLLLHCIAKVCHRGATALLSSLRSGVLYSAIHRQDSSLVFAVTLRMSEYQLFLLHWRTQASGERLVWVSRIMVFVWAIVMGCAMSVAQVASINVNFLITIIGAPKNPLDLGS